MQAGFLERALEHAENGRGTTHPNPNVGAVVVVGDEIVGRSRPPVSARAQPRSM